MLFCGIGASPLSPCYYAHMAPAAPSLRTLTLLIGVCAFVVIARLCGAAAETGNWWGATISSVHTLMVALGAYLALCPATSSVPL